MGGTNRHRGWAANAAEQDRVGANPTRFIPTSLSDKPKNGCEDPFEKIACRHLTGNVPIMQTGAFRESSIFRGQRKGFLQDYLAGEEDKQDDYTARLEPAFQSEDRDTAAADRDFFSKDTQEQFIYGRRRSPLPTRGGRTRSTSATPFAYSNLYKGPKVYGTSGKTTRFDSPRNETCNFSRVAPPNEITIRRPNVQAYASPAPVTHAQDLQEEESALLLRPGKSDTRPKRPLSSGPISLFRVNRDSNDLRNNLDTARHKVAFGSEPNKREENRPDSLWSSILPRFTSRKNDDREADLDKSSLNYTTKRESRRSNSQQNNDAGNDGVGNDGVQNHALRGELRCSYTEKDVALLKNELSFLKDRVATLTSIVKQHEKAAIASRFIGTDVRQRVCMPAGPSPMMMSPPQQVDSERSRSALAEQRNALEAKVKELESEIDVKIARIVHLEKELTELKTSLVDAQARVVEEREARTTRVKELEKKLKHMEASVEETRRKGVAQRRSSEAAAESRFTDLERQYNRDMQDLRSKLAAAEKDLIEYKDLERRLKASESRILKLERECEKLESQLASITERCAQLERECKKLEAEKVKAEKKEQQLQVKLKDLMAQRQDTAGAAREAAEKELAKASAKYQEAAEKLHQVKEREKIAESRKLALDDEVAALESERRSLRQEDIRIQADLRRLEARELSLKEHEAALGRKEADLAKEAEQLDRKRRKIADLKVTTELSRESRETELETLRKDLLDEDLRLRAWKRQLEQDEADLNERISKANYEAERQVLAVDIIPSIEVLGESKTSSSQLDWEMKYQEAMAVQRVLKEQLELAQRMVTGDSTKGVPFTADLSATEPDTVIRRGSSGDEIYDEQPLASPSTRRSARIRSHVTITPNLDSPEPSTVYSDEGDTSEKKSGSTQRKRHAPNRGRSPKKTVLLSSSQPENDGGTGSSDSDVFSTKEDETKRRTKKRARSEDRESSLPRSRKAPQAASSATNPTRRGAGSKKPPKAPAKSKGAD